jgi:hypothetical protein
VQDWDLDDDGKPETLRLFFATPKRWLEDGETINLENAPTAFGPVSVRMESKLKAGKVIAHVDFPTRNKPKSISLRARVPDGWKVSGVECNSEKLSVDKAGTISLSPNFRTADITFTVVSN